MVLSSPLLLSSRHSRRRRDAAPETDRVTVRSSAASGDRDPVRRARRASAEAEAYLAERRRRLRQRRGR